MSRAYWLNPDDRILSSQLILLQLFKVEFERIQRGIETAGGNDYDIEIVDNPYKDSALILLYQPYNLLTREFRSEKHARYLGNDGEP